MRGRTFFFFFFAQSDVTHGGVTSQWLGRRFCFDSCIFYTRRAVSLQPKACSQRAPASCPARVVGTLLWVGDKRAWGPPATPCCHTRHRACRAHPKPCLLLIKKKKCLNANISKPFHTLPQLEALSSVWLVAVARLRAVFSSSWVENARALGGL